MAKIILCATPHKILVKEDQHKTSGQTWCCPAVKVQPQVGRENAQGY